MVTVITASSTITLKQAHTCPFLFFFFSLAHFLTKTEEAFEGGKLRFSEGKRGGEEEVRGELREQIKGRGSDPGLVLGQYHPEERGT